MAATDTATRVATNEESPAAAPAKAKKSRKPLFILLGVVAVVLAAIGAFKVLTANEESTDDAQVEADVVAVAPRVAGPLKRVLVVENQTVKKDQVLFEIDESDFVVKKKQAEAELATAKAQASAADAQVSIAEATAKGGFSSATAALHGSAAAVSGADAQVAAAKAALVRSEAEAKKTQLDYDRTKQLVESGTMSKEALDAVTASNDSAQAALLQARANLASAEDQKRLAQSRVAEAKGRVDQTAPIEPQIEVARANAELAHARVQAADAALKLAELQLSYTKVTAPSDGVVSKLTVHDGALVQPGQPLVELVPSTSYVLANFKETQVGRIHPGEKVDVSIDAYPGRTFEGTVESLSHGTGARFSVLPPDNASGNFVKVVQRVPVRIAWAKQPDVALPAGLSADVTVHVK